MGNNVEGDIVHWGASVKYGESIRPTIEGEKKKDKRKKSWIFKGPRANEKVRREVSTKNKNGQVVRTETALSRVDEKQVLSRVAGGPADSQTR